MFGHMMLEARQPGVHEGRGFRQLRHVARCIDEGLRTSRRQRPLGLPQEQMEAAIIERGKVLRLLRLLFVAAWGKLG